MLASYHLVISSVTCPHYILLYPFLPVNLVVSELLRVQLSLWFYDSRILWSWYCGCVRAPGSQAASGTLRSWYDQAPGILGSCEPGPVKVSGSRASSGCCGTVYRVCAQGLLRALAQTDQKEPVPLVWWSSSVPGSCYTQSLPFGTDVVSSSPLILGLLECLVVELPLAFVGLAVEFVLKVCSGHQPRQTDCLVSSTLDSWTLFQSSSFMNSMGDLQVCFTSFMSPIYSVSLMSSSYPAFD